MFRMALFALALTVPLYAAEPDPFDQSGIPIEEQPTDPKAHKIVLIAGLASTKLKTGEHEYFAGCALLYKMLKQTPNVAPVMVRDGWPKKPETLKDVKAVVMFLEGADVHTAIKGDRFSELMKLEKAGVGFVHLHSAIDYPKDFADRVRILAGGAFEKGHSLRAHWIGEFEKFPEHPIMRGVTPFKIDDGWLWKHRFVAEMKGVTPLLRTKSPKDMGKTSADDSIVGWAYERPNGGKSFTFTGCHLHESWKIDGFRRFIVNGILWSAGQEIPKEGAPVVLKAEDEKRHLDAKPAKK
jgi:hypothetical protein